MNKAFGPMIYHTRRSDKYGKIFTRTSSSLDFKVKVVCEPCNNGWMSRMEDKIAKPAMLDLITPLSSQPLSTTHLTPDRLKAIATFAFKTAVVAHHASPYPYRLFPSLARRQFRRSFIIPAGVHMWIGEFRSEFARSGILHGHSGIAKPRSPLGIHMNVCTFIAGRLLLQIASISWANRNRRKRFPLEVVQSDEWDAVSVPFWPITGKDIIWPPVSFISRQSLAAFCNRWRSDLQLLRN